MLLGTNIRRNLATIICASMVLGTIAFAPLNFKGEVMVAHAIPVTVVADPINSANLAVNSISQVLQDAFYIKEFTLDGIANGLAKMMIKSMTTSILNWINSGFQGSPAFVTDLKQFLINRLDQTAGQMIYNDPSLNFLCSPFQLDVKVALATSYRQATRDGLKSAQCTLSDVTDNIEGFLNGSFSEGGWSSWFELTQNPVNTPTGAQLAAEGDFYARLIDERGRTVKELDWGDGFLSFKVCADTAQQKNCNITTPGRVIADQINKSLGAGQDALITADEINEIISALFAQLAQKALTGINGLLGLGGSSSYSNNSFGNGSQSYLDALNAETETSAGVLNPFATAIKREQDNIVLQNKIITRVNSVQAQLTSAQSSSCMTGQTLQNLSPILVSDKNGAQMRIILDNQHLTTLGGMEQAYLATTSAATQLALVTELSAMSQDGRLTLVTDNVSTDLYIKFDFENEAARVEQIIRSAVNSCNDDN